VRGTARRCTRLYCPVRKWL